MIKRKNGIRKFIRSFGYAFSGILKLVKSEQNARVHLLATVCVITAGILLRISAYEWCIIAIAIAIVWAAEAFNTAVERITDHLFREYDEKAKVIKDVSAGGVLICAIAAATCGLIIFLPKLIALI